MQQEEKRKNDDDPKIYRHDLYAEWLMLVNLRKQRVLLKLIAILEASSGLEWV